MSTLSDQAWALSKSIAGYLAEVIEEHGALPAREFYGTSFSALLFTMHGRPDLTRSLASRYVALSKESPQFHWEFNNYAWLTAAEFGARELQRLALPLRFKHTAVTNWVLLRCCCRVLAQDGAREAAREALDVLRHAQSSSGLICDQPGVRSVQYHCFSGALAGELFRLVGNSEFRTAFLRAADLATHLMLRTGDATYVGRGQEQSFGYGALAYLLAQAWRQTGHKRFAKHLQRCLTFLVQFSRPNGSLPLVLNGVECGIAPKGIGDQAYPGWYAYNNFFDYLPFLGVFLFKTAAACRDLNEQDLNSDAPDESDDQDYRDRDFWIHRCATYEAALGRPSGGWKGRAGYWSNDLPVPYIVAKGIRLTPSYGGEQFGSPLYSTKGIPLPLLKGTSRSIRENRVWAWWWGRRLVVLGVFGLFVRRFDFKEDRVEIDDYHCGPLLAHYLFDNISSQDDRCVTIRGGATVRSSVRMTVTPGASWYWAGPLTSMTSQQWHFHVRVTIMLPTDRS